LSPENVLWVAEVGDRETLARLVRAALLHQVAEVPLERAPAEPGRQTLQLRLRGEPIAVVGAALAESARAARSGGGASRFPLSLSPLDSSHIPALAALVDGSNAPIDRDPPTLVDQDRPEQDRTLELLPRSPPAVPVFVDDAPTRPSAPAPSPRSAPRTQRRRTGELVAVGRVIANRYRLEGLLGSGAVGAVYRASHLELPRMFALKVLHPSYRADPQLMASFRAEARAASLLDHASITVVHDFGEDPDGLVYIVMELLEGRTLQAWLDEAHRLEPRRAVAIMLQVCAALAVAHDRGIVHRDVKPDNIMLVPTRDDEGATFELAKVCDFGIAALDSAPDAAGSGLTAGTPEYMAPEQAAGRADPRTDIYACGVVLYEMLCGRPPFVAETPAALLAKHASERPTPPSELIAGVPSALEAVVLRTLEKDPARRHPTMRELRADLKRTLD